ncbi:RluA family pseudouridine synthase [Candidatus Riesia pediculischaeffi]|uniref:Pseudouridine synthase n=1 Tax=Candidatus Riesia pediculischaeffi TaxID=428411 RepID=A0A1V0HKZ1_9ENTR|nr:RluA family pseudouridine synthase [Candidatus Riesia pediculischaeffi]ARC53483.1 hypothetical protein AOQ87_02420 [Candidatus Riesia pediculischaeffi]
MKIKIKISPLSYPKRIDKVIYEHLINYSRSDIKRWIIKKKVYVNQVLIDKPSTKLSGRECILIEDIENSKEEYYPKNIPLNVVHEDGSIIVIDKQHNLCVHPGKDHEQDTLLNALIHHFPKLKDVPRAGIVHRLDKDTSGLMIVAKSSHIQNQLMKLFKIKKVRKEYEAVVYGNINIHGTIDQPIGRHPVDRRKNFVCRFGKKSRTQYYVEENFNGFTRLTLSLESGRRHQARVHMKYINHPIVGDPLYHDKKLSKMKKNHISNSVKVEHIISRQALHAKKLSILHPTLKKMITWKSDVPKDITHLVHTLRENKKL